MSERKEAVRAVSAWAVLDDFGRIVPEWIETTKHRAEAMANLNGHRFIPVEIREIAARPQESDSER